METIYRCSNCEANINEDDLFCSSCGGAVQKDYVGAGVKVEVVGIGRAVSVHYRKVIPINYNQLFMAQRICQIFPKLEIVYTNPIELEYKNNCVLKIKNNELSFVLSKEDRKKYMDSVLFANQVNKRQVWWTTPYYEINFNIYLDLINNRINEI